MSERKELPLPLPPERAQAAHDGKMTQFRCPEDSDLGRVLIHFLSRNTECPDTVKDCPHGEDKAILGECVTCWREHFETLSGETEEVNDGK